MMLWDNITCKTRDETYGPVWAGGVFQIASNRGVLHDEGREIPKHILLANPEKIGY